MHISLSCNDLRHRLTLIRKYSWYIFNVARVLDWFPSDKVLHRFCHTCLDPNLFCLLQQSSFIFSELDRAKSKAELPSIAVTTANSTATNITIVTYV